MLPAICDRKKTYYKITNKEECHNGLQYHDGLVIDPKPFNHDPKASCVKGGIYFTTKEYLHRFMCGCWIRPVRIPEDAQVILDPEGDKYRADKLIFLSRKTFDFYFNKWFNKKTFPKEDYWCLAEHCSKYFNKWFDKKTFPKKYYWCLAEYCSKYFNKWFDKKTFPEESYWSLAKYCPDHFDKWFDKKTFPKEDYWSLVKYCPEHFDKWFDKKTFPKKDYWSLVKNCPEHFDKWFDKKTFPKEYYWRLVEYYPKYFNKWVNLIRKRFLKKIIGA